MLWSRKQQVLHSVVATTLAALCSTDHSLSMLLGPHMKVGVRPAAMHTSNTTHTNDLSLLCVMAAVCTGRYHTFQQQR